MRPPQFLLMALALCVTMFATSGCKSTKRITIEPTKKYDKSEILQSLVDNNLSYEWYAAKAKLKFDSPQESGKGSLYLRLQKDSIIWLTAKKYGVTGVRSLITPDSFTIVYQIERKYDQGEFQNLTSAFAIDGSFSDLQDLIVGNIILPKQEADIRNFEYHDAKYHFDAIIANAKISYIVDANTLLLSKVSVVEGSGREATFEYDDYQTVGNYKLPYKRKATFVSSPTESYRLDLKFAKIELEVPKSTRLPISPRFKRVK